MSVPGHDDYDEHPTGNFPHLVKHAAHKGWHFWHMVHNIIAGYGLAEAINHIRETITDTRFLGH